MGGRALNPGESARPGDLLNPEGVHNRTIRAFVGTVDNENGIIKLDHNGFPANGREASCPWMWASFRDSQTVAWGRYMPFEGDSVKVSFDYDDTPHVVGFDLPAGDLSVSVTPVGWPQFNKLFQEDVLPEFRPLRSGEYDFMSVGGAYIYGSDYGQLLLAGGLATVAIDKGTNSIEANARVHKVQSSSSVIKFGEVRRPNPVTFAETLIGPWNPTTTGREFDVKLSYSDGALDHSIARLGVGNLANDVTVEMSFTGAPRRVAIDVYDPAGVTEVFKLDVDATGSAKIGSPTAPLFKIDYPVGLVTVAGAQVTLEGTRVAIGSAAAMEPGILGLTFAQALVELLASGMLQCAVGPVYVNPAWIAKYLGNPTTNILSTKVMLER